MITKPLLRVVLMSVGISPFMLILLEPRKFEMHTVEPHNTSLIHSMTEHFLRFTRFTHHLLLLKLIEIQLIRSSPKNTPNFFLWICKTEEVDIVDMLRSYWHAKGSFWLQPFILTCSAHN